MDLREYDTAIRVWVLVSFVVGVALIVRFGDFVPTLTGVVLVIVSLLSLMAVVRNALVTDADAPP